MRVDRLEELRQYIRQNKTVSITDITDHFHISMSTVRRDLSALLEEREFKKVYGGSVSTICEPFLSKNV